MVRTIAISALLACLASVSIAAELRGTVREIKGQRVTVKTPEREVTVSVPAGTKLKVGDKVTVTVEPVGDAMLVRTVVLSPD